MKKSRSLSLLTLAVILLLTSEVPWVSANASVQRSFRIEEYELFYRVLHPLQQVSLPQKDFRRIRSQGGELIRRGQAIVKLGVPEAPSPNRRRFAQQRRTFARALARFNSEARSRSNSRLRVAFANVHNSFEKLADLVPTVYLPRGMPPTVRLDCPADYPIAGSKITFMAHTPHPEKLIFTWAVSAGTIISGNGTPKITIDTSDLAGQTISVSVEVNDRFGLTAYADCKVQIAAAQELRNP